MVSQSPVVVKGQGVFSRDPQLIARGLRGGFKLRGQQLLGGGEGGEGRGKGSEGGEC